MICVSITRDGQGFFATLRKCDSSARGEETGPLFNAIERKGSVSEAKEYAEKLFGLLDWGYGGQPANQAVVVVE